MGDSEREELLAQCVADLHRRRAVREAGEPEDYRERLGEDFSAFLDILAAEECIDQVVNLAPEAPFPRPFGEYTLIREVGRGGMGVVYEAVQRALGRRVAVKILRTGFDTDRDALQRFRQEALACAQVRHDNIVEIYEVGQFEGRPYFVMPLLFGRSLDRLILEGEAPEPRSLCRGLAGIADGLAALHRVGFIHRDVKPANVLVESSGRMVLMDFGLARGVNSEAITQPGQTPGTPHYMSPEQLLGQRDRIDGRSDIYGLGATLYHAVARETPFEVRSVRELIRLVLSERPRPLTDPAPDAPLECGAIALKALEQRPEDRYQTAEEMRDDLLAFAEGRPVLGRPVSTVRRILRRYGGRIALSAVVLVALVVGLFWYLGRPGTVEVETLPSQALMLIDEREKGRTPLSVDVPPGDHELALVARGFEVKRKRFWLGPGQTRTFDLELIALEECAEDPDVLGEIGRVVGLDVGRFEPPDRDRGGASDGLITMLFPRGEVRAEDLLGFRAERVARIEPEGPIRFLRGGEVLLEAAFGSNVVIEGTIPPEVRRALKPGDVVTWGYFPQGGEPVTVQFHVVIQAEAGEVRRRVGNLEERLSEQPGVLVRHLVAQLYLDRRLDQAALNVAVDLVAEDPRSIRGWALYEQILHRMGVLGTRLGGDVQWNLDQFDDEERSKVYLPPGR